MPVGSSQGQTYADPFDFMVQTAQQNTAKTPVIGEGIVSKEGQTPPTPDLNLQNQNQKMLDLIKPDYLNPPEFDPKASLPDKPGKIPAVDRDVTGTMTKAALDAATAAMPLGPAAKVAAAIGPGAKAFSKGTFEALEAEIKELLTGIDKSPGKAFQQTDVQSYKDIQEKMKQDINTINQNMPKHDPLEQIPWAPDPEIKLKEYYSGDTVTHKPSAEQSAAEYAMRVINQTKTPEQLATKAEMEAKWKAWNEMIDKTFPDPTISSKIFDIAKSYVGKMKAKVDSFDKALEDRVTAGLKNKYAMHMEPVDWQKLKSPLMGTEYETEESAVAKRARNLGFNVDFPLFKGGSKDPKKIEHVPDPTNKGYERGVFYSDKYEIADSYASDTGHVGTYVARAPKALMVDYTKATGRNNYDPSHMTPLIEAAREKQADMLIVKNMHDVGGKQDQYVILNPSVVRRPDAAFDPEKLHLNHLLAGIGGMGVVAHEGLKPDKE